MTHPTLNCHLGDCLDIMRTWPDEFVQCVVTSPPYWGLRDYGVDGQIGLEPTLTEWLERMQDVFAEIRRVLKPDGTLWLNMGDCYANAGSGLSKKNLVGQPWRLAFALQDAGWILRQDIIWHKPQPMPEFVRDRCTKAHEYLFLLSREPTYQFDFEAFKEPATGNAHARGSGVNQKAVSGWATGSPKDKGRDEQVLRDSSKFGRGPGWRNRQNESFSAAVSEVVTTRNRRSVWTVPTYAFEGAHFATFPPKLIEPCILAGSRPGDIVLDPFMGSGTTAMVAEQLGRKWIGCELNPEYLELQADRLRQTNLELT